MAHTVNDQRVSVGEGLGLGSRNASGTIEKVGAVKFMEVDITSYPTNGETVNAHELGLSEIYGVIGGTNEADNDYQFQPVVAANRKSVVINAFEGTAEVSNTTDVGKTVWVVWGEALGQEA